MRTSMLGILAVLILTGTSDLAAGSKPSAPTANWTCKIELRNAPGDTITSDGGGAYVHGTGGVQCTIIRDRESHYNWLYVVFADKSPRSMIFPGQSNGSASYLSFANKGSFEVEGLADVAWTGTAYVDVRPFRALVFSPQFSRGAGEFHGHSNYPGGPNIPDGAPYVGTSSVFVQALTTCSWQIASYTTEDTSLIALDSGERDGTIKIPTRVMRLSEGVSPKITVRGDFPMAFGAKVTIIGNMPGCPLP
jgi:hypothetical protein